jgi:hypothetical protein
MSRYSDASWRSSGERPARGNCPVVSVVISGADAGDQTVESPEVKVPVGWAEARSAPTGGEQVVQFGVGRECAKAGIEHPYESGCGIISRQGGRTRPKASPCCSLSNLRCCSGREVLPLYWSTPHKAASRPAIDRSRIGPRPATLAQCLRRYPETIENLLA